MTNKIKFLAQSEHVWNVRERPIPAVKKLPNWWKNMSVYTNSERKFSLDPAPNLSVKKCVPTLDIFSAGYYMPLWSDVLIEQENDFPLAKWNGKELLFETWNSGQVSNFEFEEKYSRTTFKYYHGWTIKTPPGWSSFIIHPVAYPNLPFKSISGIVDTDVFDGEINVPFIIKKGFEGVIEKGTPMFQIIPFKRDNWISDFELKKPNQHYFDQSKIFTKINRAYFYLLKNRATYK